MAALCMAGATFTSSLINAFLRYLSQEVPPVEVAFFRMFFGVLFMLPVVFRMGLGVFKTNRHGLFLLRGVITAVMTVGWTIALSRMSIDKATALSFTLPLWMTVGAAVLLGEGVGWRRWAAVCAGFAGSLIILRPGFAAFEPVAALPLIVAAFAAAVMLIVKVLSRTESPQTVVLYMGIYSTPFLFVMALPVWVRPSSDFLFWTFIIGALGAIGHLLYTRTMALVDASVAASYDFMRLPSAALIGFVWFGELMDLWGWIGAGVILSAAAYTAHRETRQPGTARSLRDPTA